MRRPYSVETMRRLFIYNPSTGHLIWKIRRGKMLPGMRAGYTDPKGYVVVGVGNEHYLAHNIIWAITHGVWPEQDVDHENRLKGDNKEGNLREATRSQNKINSGPYVTNTSGYRGVYPDGKGRWRASIKHNYKGRLIGTFDTKEEAYEARLRVEKELFGEFANTR